MKNTKLAVNSTDIVDQLHRRSKALYKYARIAFEKGDHDLNIFMYKHSIQLRLKALLLRLPGFTQRMHNVRELLSILSKTLKDLDREELKLLRNTKLINISKLT